MRVLKKGSAVEYPPMRRTVSIRGRLTTLYFPYMVFWIQHPSYLHLAFSVRRIARGCKIYASHLPNTGGTYVCLGKHYDVNVKIEALVQRFWASGFNDEMGYQRNRLSQWKKINTEKALFEFIKENSMPCTLPSFLRPLPKSKTKTVKRKNAAKKSVVRRRAQGRKKAGKSS